MLVYDNACNLWYSAARRAPVILQSTRVIVDRFHWLKGHKCCGIFDADRHVDMDNTRSESAEAINSFIDRAKNFMQHLSWPNFVSFLRVRFAIRNYFSVLRDRDAYGDDSEVRRLFDLFSNDMKCRNCELCQCMDTEEAWISTIKKTITRKISIRDV